MCKVKKETYSEINGAGCPLTVSEFIAIGLRKYGIPKCVLVDDSQIFRKIEKKKK